MRHALMSAAASMFLLAGSGLAADLPRRVEPPPPLFSWPGFYAGINAGCAFTNEQVIRTRGNNGAGALEGPTFTGTVANVATGRRPGTCNSESEGLTGGGQIGHNLQLKKGDGVVIGLETDIAYTDLTKNQRFTGTLDDRSTFRQSLEYLGTLRGRVGSSCNQFLIYGTGGLGRGNADDQARFFSNAAGQPLAHSGGRNQICLIPRCGGTVCHHAARDALWAKFFTAVPPGFPALPRLLGSVGKPFRRARIAFASQMTDPVAKRPVRRQDIYSHRSRSREFFT